ncbi:MAG TPA: Ig-like domain-containing protein [Blastocatellia bacterium]|nr:Ig-like domain-containing protein [Blastocatellia bacterium]
MKWLLVTLAAAPIFLAVAFVPCRAQNPTVTRVEINPPAVAAEIGQQLKFTAVALDASGKALELKPMMWFAAPFDLASADQTGTVSIFGPGEVRVGVVIGGKVGYAKITVKAAKLARLVTSPAQSTVMVGSVVRLVVSAYASNGDPRTDAAVSWTSRNPGVARVDPAGVVTGRTPGKTEIVASSDGVTSATTVTVTQNSVHQLSIQPATATARTGDVISFKAVATDHAGGAVETPGVIWSAAGDGASIWPDGGFVAARPGSYIVTASVGGKVAIASVVVSPRNVERELTLVGRVAAKDFQIAEQWAFGNYVYLSSISDKVLAYDISNPSQPKLTDTLKVDARIINDVSTTADGRIGVFSREGASNRKNGIVFLDTSDPAHPRILSEYTETVSGGVHSAFVDSHYVYLTDDATGSLRIIDFKDVKNPKEVARWEVHSPLVKPARLPSGDESTAGRYLHDVQVVGGLAYLAYWRDGLVVLDVGNGIKGGSPEKPQFVSQFRFNHNELYGDGWLAGAHAVFRYKNYVFVGDEVFPSEFNIMSKDRIPVRGIVHVIDVSDILNPRKVAEYDVPDGGAHNIWVKDDILYMGYYSGGGRVLDVSGELRGDLYAQGREIASLWTGDPNGFRSNLPFTWGAQPHGDLVLFNDINSGLWIVKLGKPKFKGSTPAPAP